MPVILSGKERIPPAFGGGKIAANRRVGLGDHGDKRMEGLSSRFQGDVAQLGERLLCKQDVVGSIPSISTNADLAQLVERVPSKHKVASSNLAVRSSLSRALVDE